MNNYIRRHSRLLCVLLLLLTACVTKPAVYVSKNYSDDDIRSLELQRIEKKLTEQPVAVLWQTRLIKDDYPQDEAAKQLYQSAEDAAYSLLLKAVEKNDTIEVRRLYNSLVAVDSEKLQGLLIPSKTLNGFSSSLQTESGQTAAGQNLKVSQMIRGTVTIWVDRGIKIERGMGYADRVIGSGFFIDNRGYLVTNYHVISSEVDPKYEGFSRLYIRLADDPDTRIPAKVIGWDEALDLALLKTEATAPYVFPLGSSDDLDIGDRIYAIGSPVGLEKTLTSGIVSATERKLFAMGDVMQIDAAINSGNSGGPIIDQNGSVQGIVFAGIKPYEGLNFAIPVEYLKLELDRLHAGGKIIHAWFGAFGRTKKEAGEPLPQGIEILYVLPGTTSHIAGLEPGDILQTVNGETMHTIEQLKNRLLTLTPQTIIKTTGITATGASFEKILCLDARPDNPGYEIYQRDTLANSLLPIMGMQLAAVSDTNSKRFNVSALLKAGIADESGFSEMDYIEINRVRISPEKDAMMIELYTKKRRSGYLDMFLSLIAPLDSPAYF